MEQKLFSKDCVALDGRLDEPVWESVEAHTGFKALGKADAVVEELQTFFKIILPQVIKRVIPPVTNETITLVKDTSLAFAITCPEMFTLAKQVAAKEATVMPLMVAGLFYFIFNNNMLYHKTNVIQIVLVHKA